MTKLVANDPWLKPYEERIRRRMEFTHARERSITQGGDIPLEQFADGYLHYGLHRDKKKGCWILREFLPGAHSVQLIGSFNDWQRMSVWKLKRVDDYGNWEIHISDQVLHHGDLYRLFVCWGHDCGERIPAWASRVVQDSQTGIFSAQVWDPEEPYVFRNARPGKKDEALMIYECHVGMSSEEGKVSTYREFQEQVLPRVVDLGYNAIQIMAVQEHPYYGSFGYHVSSFYAPSSRFGTPDDLKALIDAAHGLGLKVIMDLVHSHAVRNEVEGLARYDGSRTLFFHEGPRGDHPAWDSLCFDYGRNNVMHFLLSNCKYWLEVFQFDGFRFDGVSSMLYYNHGLGESFNSYSDYFNGLQDADAMAYLTLANKLIHSVYPDAITIAEEVSGMPGLASPIEDGGFGFDYRLSMNIPDFWTKLITERPDEEWSPGAIWYELTNRREEEKTISYAESHDQALVGDKTIIFRLADAEMYWHMSHSTRTLQTDRAVALDKLIRLATVATMNGGYLNFMGNEFGHPEWIDFPREGNGWSYHYARRQWSLADNKDLLYHDLQSFDKAMVHLVASSPEFTACSLQQYHIQEEEQILAFGRGDLIFVFNFHPTRSYTDYQILLPKGSYTVVLDTDSKDFGGYALVDDTLTYQSLPYETKTLDCEALAPLALYIPSRTALVLRRK